MKTGITFAAVLLFTATIHGSDWTRFRGPNGSGVTESAPLPVEFGPDKNFAWKAAVPPGRSSPVLGAEVLFLTAFEDGDLITVCLERETGAVRWQRSIARPRAADMYAGNDSASPTPVTDGENVYVFFQEFGLVSYDADGSERWQLPLGPFNNFYGVAASPIVSDDTLLMLCDQQSGSFLVAVDCATGEERWKVDRSGLSESWTTPILDEPADGPVQVIVFGCFRVDAYSVGSGEHLWGMDGFGYTPVSSPVLNDRTLYLCTPAHTEESPMPGFDTLLASDKNGDGKLTKAELQETPLNEHFGWADADKDGLVTREEWDYVAEGMSSRNYGLAAVKLEDSGKPEELWRVKKHLPSITTPLVYEDVLYAVKDGGILTSMDSKTGKVHKRERIEGAGGEYFPSPIAADDKIFLASQAGTIAVLNAGADWEVLAVNDFEEEINATPAVGDGKLYLRTATSLYCLRRPDSP